MITLELYELKNICMDMSELGAANYAKQVAPASDAISQREAYRLFGEARVKRWVALHLVNTTRNGNTIRSKKLYSRSELLSAQKAEKLEQIINK